MTACTGTSYAGEMKKGVFTIMHYLMPKRNILSLHSGCNIGKAGDVTLFFGLSAREHSASRRGSLTCSAMGSRCNEPVNKGTRRAMHTQSYLCWKLRCHNANFGMHAFGKRKEKPCRQ
eukprot:1144812-Pelagomonas_calceolata.AAC.5